MAYELNENKYAGKFRNKTVVITGASSGIGRGTALAFGRAGANVVICGRAGELLEDLVDTINNLGGRAISVEADVSKESDMEKVAAAAASNFGRIDIWVNNAGVYIMGKFEEIPIEDFERVMEVNYLGVVNGCRAALRYMRKARGVIINIGSVAGKNGYKYASPYAASKFAVTGFSQALRQELKDKNIDVCLVLPASTDTPLFSHAANYVGKEIIPMPPVASAEHVADVILNTALNPKAEVFATASGAMHTAANRLSQKLFDTAMPKYVEKAHFSKRKVSYSDGNLFEPDTDHPQVSGGWKMRYDQGGTKAVRANGGGGGAFGTIFALGLAGAGIYYLFGDRLRGINFGGRQPENLPGSVANPAQDIA